MQNGLEQRLLHMVRSGYRLDLSLMLMLRLRLRLRL